LAIPRSLSPSRQRSNSRAVSSAIGLASSADASDLGSVPAPENKVLLESVQRFRNRERFVGLVGCAMDEFATLPLCLPEVEDALAVGVDEIVGVSKPFGPEPALAISTSGEP
jgi:hypothetical protein